MQQRSDRELYWRKFETRRDRHESYAVRRIQSAFVEQYQAVMSAIMESDVATIIGALQFHLSDEPLRRAYGDIYARVGSDFAEQSLTGIKSAFPHIETKDMEAVRDHWNDHMRLFVEQRAGTRIRQVNSVTLERVRTALTRGHNEGLGIEVIARELRQSTAFSMARTRTIARTEIVSASNEGSYLGAQETNLPLEKIWIATPDERTRPAHWEADGSTVELRGEFRVDGELLTYPGDPQGSAENVINCRCAIGYTVIE